MSFLSIVNYQYQTLCEVCLLHIFCKITYFKTVEVEVENGSLLASHVFHLAYIVHGSAKCISRNCISEKCICKDFNFSLLYFLTPTFPTTECALS